jgi:hypothetical protein
VRRPRRQQEKKDQGYKQKGKCMTYMKGNLMLLIREIQIKITMA